MDLKKAQQIARELHKPIIKKFEKRKVVATEPWEILAIDLCEMSKFDGYKYILTIIDVYTKYGFAIPLKNKTGKVVSEAFENVIKDNPPKLVWNDKGKEFWNKDFKAVNDKYGIDMYTTQNEEKCTVVERYNRTLKEKMEQELTVKSLIGKEADWVSILPKIVQDYNNHIHSTIKMSPNDAIKTKNRDKLDENWNKHLHREGRLFEDPMFNVGDYVRIYRWKKEYEKGYKANWTQEVFRIKEVRNTRPITYIIEDKDGEEIIGSFYSQELMRTNSMFTTSLKS